MVAILWIGNWDMISPVVANAIRRSVAFECAATPDQKRTLAKLKVQLSYMTQTVSELLKSSAREDKKAYQDAGASLMDALAALQKIQ